MRVESLVDDYPSHFVAVVHISQCWILCNIITLSHMRLVISESSKNYIPLPPLAPLSPPSQPLNHHYHRRRRHHHRMKVIMIYGRIYPNFVKSVQKRRRTGIC